MNHARKRHFTFLASCLLMVMLLAACGDDESPETTLDEVSNTPVGDVATAPTATTPLDAPSTEPTMTQPADTATMETGSAATAPAGATPAAEPADDDPLPEPDNPAPELTTAGEWYNSEPLTLAELRGNPVLLVFWASH